MIVADELMRKAQLIVDLRLKENNLNEQLHHIDVMMKYVMARAKREKKKLAKSISHNMRFRNKIINEVTDLKKQL
jgi:hypothetical protein